ncbi:MAG: hypothetical protein EBU97_01915 [Rhodobacteraceae bacterium]|nr:hypothetical protein [Paracoccaceae bacterium]
MSDQSLPQGPADPLLPAKIVYGLFAAGYVLGGLPTIVGLIYAYVERGKNRELDSHLTLLIRTFWFSLLMFLVGLITIYVVVGVFLLIYAFVWNLTRLISGFVLVMDDKPVVTTRYWGILAR